MLEGEHDQIYSLVQIHQETGHIRIRDGDGIARLDLVDKQWDDTAARAHNVTITSAADGRTATLSRHTGICKDNMLHHSLGDTHGIDRISRLIRRQTDNTLDTGIDSSMQNIVCADDIGLNSLHRKKLTGRNLLQSSSMEDVVNTGHSVLDGLRVADITDVELDLLGCFRVFCLKLMAHIVLLLLIAGEDADFLEIRIQKVLQHGGAERTGTTSDHKGCVIKCRHFYFLLCAVKTHLSSKLHQA